jgi:hypothetical protein
MKKSECSKEKKEPITWHDFMGEVHDNVVRLERMKPEVFD